MSMWDGQNDFNTALPDFDKRFKRAQTFAKVWIAFCFILVLTIIFGTGYAVFEVVTNPAAVGEFFGQIASGFNKEVS